MTRQFFILRILEWALALLFLYAAYFKLLDPQSFVLDLQNYRVIPGFLLWVPALVIPALELLCGLSLILGIYRVEGSFWLILLMLGFLGGEAQALIRGLDINCGCFGKEPDKLTYQTILRNLAILVAALWVWYREIKLRNHVN